MRIALALLLIIAAAPACADWVKVGELDNASIYIDRATIEKNGQLRTLWEMQEMKQIGPDGIASIRALQEYDCVNRRFRYLSLLAYSSPTAGQRVLLTEKIEDEWSYLPPGSTSSKERMVCAL